MDTHIDAPLILPFDGCASAVSESVAHADHNRRVVLAAIVVGMLLFLSDHDWFVSQYVDFSATSDSMEAGAAGGNLIRGSAIFALGLAGLATLFWKGGYSLRIRGPLGLLMLGVVLWSAASWFWSIEPAIALRRLIASGCLALAAMAAAKLLTPRQLAGAALACAVAFLALGGVTEILLGTFQPWRGDYRFSGTLHPNHQGLNCAMIVMAATYLASVSRQHRKALCALAVAGLAGLWMTKSRTPLAALVAAEAVFWFLAASWKQKIAWSMTVIGVACAVMLVADDDLLERAANAAMLGRADEESSGALTGRVPLWEELSESIARRPLAGFGFNSFWIPTRIEDISDSQSWAISVAHSTYLDLTLGIGLVGAGMCMAVVLMGWIRALQLNVAQSAMGYGFIAVLLLFALLHGLLESAFANPGFAPLVAQAGLAMLAFVDPREYVESAARSNGEASGGRWSPANAATGNGAHL